MRGSSRMFTRSRRTAVLDSAAALHRCVGRRQPHGQALQFCRQWRLCLEHLGPGRHTYSNGPWPTPLPSSARDRQRYEWGCGERRFLLVSSRISWIACYRRLRCRARGGIERRLTRSTSVWPLSLQQLNGSLKKQVLDVAQGEAEEAKAHMCSKRRVNLKSVARSAFEARRRAFLFLPRSGACGTWHMERQPAV